VIYCLEEDGDKVKLKYKHKGLSFMYVCLRSANKIKDKTLSLTMIHPGLHADSIAAYLQLLLPRLSS